MKADLQFEPLRPILVAPLLRKVDRLLVSLLRSLTSDDWQKKITAQWTVHDVAAHLLDTSLRKLSLVRDAYFPQPPPEIRSNADFIAFINRLNAEGVAYYRRLSGTVLTSLIEKASEESADYYESLDPMAHATFSVSWAGEQVSKNWFDTARELTERWHHQQQIRDAVGKPGIMTRDLYHPVLDCFLRALPHHYRDIARPNGSTLQVIVDGECGGVWSMVRQRDAWILTGMLLANPLASISIPQEIAWRIFTKGIDRESARGRVTITGDEQLAGHLLTMLSIVA